MNFCFMLWGLLTILSICRAGTTRKWQCKNIIPRLTAHCKHGVGAKSPAKQQKNRAAGPKWPTALFCFSLFLPPGLKASPPGS